MTPHRQPLPAGGVLSRGRGTLEHSPWYGYAERGIQLGIDFSDRLIRVKDTV